jgi:hypothetical protein
VVCNQAEPPLCLYRHAAADLVARRRYEPSWRQADRADAASREGRRDHTWDVCQDAAYELIEFPEADWPQEARMQVGAAARRTALCFAQQMLAEDPGKVPRTSRRILARVMQKAGIPSQEPEANAP